MVLELHGSPHSTCSQRVLVIAQELGLEVTLVPVDFSKGEHKSPEVNLGYQPFGQVPYLKDGDFILFESRAISKYLARKHADGRLLPAASDLQAVAIFDQGCSVEQADFDPYASGLVAEKVFVPRRGGVVDEAKVAKCTETLINKMQGYERILAKQKYLGGNELTVVDFFHLPYGTMAEQFSPESFETHPHVKAWWEGLKSRESWSKVKGPSS